MVPGLRPEDLSQVLPSPDELILLQNHRGLAARWSSKPASTRRPYFSQERARGKTTGRWSEKYRGRKLCPTRLGPTGESSWLAYRDTDSHISLLDGRFGGFVTPITFAFYDRATCTSAFALGFTPVGYTDSSQGRPTTSTRRRSSLSGTGTQHARAGQSAQTGSGACSDRQEGETHRRDCSVCLCNRGEYSAYI